MKIIKEDVLVLMSIVSFVLANVDQCSAGHTGMKERREL
jgi:hypothetical protein